MSPQDAANSGRPEPPVPAPPGPPRAPLPAAAAASPSLCSPESESIVRRLRARPLRSLAARLAARPRLGAGFRGSSPHESGPEGGGGGGRA